VRKLLLALIVMAGVALGQDVASPAAPEKPTKPKGVIHLQEVKDPPDVQAKENCNNFSFAAALAGALSYENAEIKQDYWIDKLYGGGVCVEIGDPQDLARKVAGSYVLDDGRHVDVSLEYFPGVPSNSAAFLVPVMTDEILIVFVEGHADLLVGAMWDEYRSTRGERMIDLKELHLLDPLATADKRKAILDVAGEDAAKITGYMQVKTVEVDKAYWPK
jgi:hypothetical protein